MGASMSVMGGPTSLGLSVETGHRLRGLGLSAHLEEVFLGASWADTAAAVPRRLGRDQT